MAKKAEEKFVTEDDREFSTMEEAEDHERFQRLNSEYRAARSRFLRLVHGRERTADGHLFRYSSWRYWRITESYFEMPTVVPVHLALEICHFDEVQGAADQATVAIRRGDRRDHVRISELYWSERAAKEACLQLQRKRLKELTGDVEELARSLESE